MREPGYKDIGPVCARVSGQVIADMLRFGPPTVKLGRLSPRPMLKGFGREQANKIRLKRSH